MSLSRPLFRRAVAAIVFAGAAALSACTLSPVYSDNAATNAALAMNFAAPNNPLEQIVYEDLTRRFGTSDSPNAALVSVAVSSASRDLAMSTITDPSKGELLTATGLIKITRGGAPILTANRQATATYSSDSQVIADNSGVTAAQEQAAHALAETLELTIISALAPSPASQ